MYNDDNQYLRRPQTRTREEQQTNNGFLQRASSFISRHVKQGEKLLEKERLEKEYALEDYMSQYVEAFDTRQEYEQARSRVLDQLAEELMQDNPDRKKFTFRVEYLEQRIDALFALEIGKRMV